MWPWCFVVESGGGQWGGTLWEAARERSRKIIVTLVSCPSCWNNFLLTISQSGYPDKLRLAFPPLLPSPPCQGSYHHDDDCTMTTTRDNQHGLRHVFLLWLLVLGKFGLKPIQTRFEPNWNRVSGFRFGKFCPNQMVWFPVSAFSNFLNGFKFGLNHKLFVLIIFFL